MPSARSAARAAALVRIALAGSGVVASAAPMSAWGALHLAAFAATACGGSDRPLPRGVIENDVGGWNFRRYQSVLDVEVWVSGNRAVAHTASYADREAEKRGRLSDESVVSAFVTRYQSDAGIDRALIQFARRLASESGYRVEERELGDVRLVEIRGAGEIWAMWPAPRHIVKVGGPGRESIPEAVVAAYGERYPSRLAAGALDAPLPPERSIDVAPAREAVPGQGGRPSAEPGRGGR